MYKDCEQRDQIPILFVEAKVYTLMNLKCVFINSHNVSLSPVFIYSMPGYSCSIKERMLYSSCKSRLLEEVEKDYHLEITKKV